MAYSTLRPPVVLGAVATAFVARPVTINGIPVYDRQAMGSQRRSVNWKLRPPAVVAPAIIFAPVAVHRASTPARFYKVKSRLQSPAVLGTPPAPFVSAPVSVRSAKLIPRRIQVSYRLRAPVVVGAAIVFRPVRVKTVTRPSRFNKAVYRLQAPTIMGDVVVVVPPTPPRVWSPFIDNREALSYPYENFKIAPTPMRDSLRKRR